MWPELQMNRRYGTFTLSQRVEAASVEITLVPLKMRFHIQESNAKDVFVLEHSLHFPQDLIAL